MYGFGYHELAHDRHGRLQTPGDLVRQRGIRQRRDHPFLDTFEHGLGVLICQGAQGSLGQRHDADAFGEDAVASHVCQNGEHILRVLWGRFRSKTRDSMGKHRRKGIKKALKG